MSQLTTARAENPAELYEHYWVSAVHGPFATDLVARVAPRAGERILDVACGTGIVARTIARTLRTHAAIDGLDINPLMLAVARQRSAAEGLDISWHEGDAAALPFDDGSFDLVICQQALQLVPEPAAAVREMYRVLAPDGRVAVSAWTAIDRNPVDQIVAGAFARHAETPIFDVVFSLGDREVFAAHFAAAGFEEIDMQAVSLPARFRSADEYVDLIVTGTVAAIPALRDMSDAEQARAAAAIRADIGAGVEPYIENGTLVVVSETGVLQARKPADISIP